MTGQRQTSLNLVKIMDQIDHDWENGILDAKLEGMSVDGMHPQVMITWLSASYPIHNKGLTSWFVFRDKVVDEYRKRGYDINQLKGLRIEDGEEG